ncbi:MAG: ribonuclease HI [Bacteroidales bacterium]|jgi:ribonuclease HI|nr:ribonuclease HI [Bacteroidales bacterium]
MAHEVTIYTDGACSGNPGPGGYGVVLISGRHRKELSEGFRLTTNNRMELLAAIKGLEALKKPGTDVKLHTDSQYLVNAVNQGWLFGWEKKHFAKKKNPDLWIRFLNVYRRHKVTLIWIKGHNNNPENERCDTLAVAASRNSNLTDDTGYHPEDDNASLL